MKRRFEFKSDKAYKFWQIEVNRQIVRVSFGRIGKPGQTREKSFGTPEAALEHTDRKIREKKKAGYVEVIKKPIQRKSNEAHRQELLDHEPFLGAIIAEPDEFDGYLIYADWLTEHGDPRADLIRCQIGLKDPDVSMQQQTKLEKQEKELISQNWRDWLAELSEFYTLPTFSVGFEFGFPSRMAISSMPEAIASKLRNFPFTRLMRSLQVRGTTATDLSSVGDPIRLLVGADFACLKRFHCTTYFGESVFELIHTMPRLEDLQLDLTGNEKEYPLLFDSDLPQLKRFVMRENLNRAAIDKLITSGWLDHLESLELYGRLTDGSCDALAKAIKASPTLEEVSVDVDRPQSQLEILRSSGVTVHSTFFPE